MGRRVGQGGSHKATWRQLNETHTHTHTQFLGLDDIQRLKINYELRYCSVRFSNRKGRDLKHAFHVLKRGRARVVITVRVSERRFIIKMLGLLSTKFVVFVPSYAFNP